VDFSLLGTKVQRNEKAWIQLNQTCVILIRWWWWIG